MERRKKLENDRMEFLSPENESKKWNENENKETGQVDHNA